jgi:hypothetical protein
VEGGVKSRIVTSKTIFDNPILFLQNVGSPDGTGISLLVRCVKEAVSLVAATS